METESHLPADAARTARTLLVRLWEPEVRGFVHDLAAGREHAFANPDELVAIVRELATASARP